MSNGHSLQAEAGNPYQQTVASLTALFQSTEDLIWSVDLNFRILTMNEALRQHLERNFGVSAALGKLPEEVLPPERADFWSQLFRRALTEGPFREEILFPDGRTLEFVFNPIVLEARISGISMFGRDITDRIAADLAIKSAERRYKDIFDGAIEGMFQNRGDGKPIRINRALAAILGYDSREDFLSHVHDAAADIWRYPEDRRRLLRELAHHRAVRGFETQFRRKDGTYIWVSLSVRRELEADQSEPLLDGFFEDITKRKETEIKLHESLESLREAQTIGDLGSYVFDVATARWTSSQKMDEIFGIGPDFDRGVEGWTSLIHPGERDTMSSYFLDDVLARHSAFDKQYRIIRPADQQVRWVHGWGQLDINPEGQPVRMRGVIKDITQEKAKEIQLRASEERFRATFEQAAIGIVHCSFQGEILRCNSHFSDLLGYQPSELLGKSMGQLIFSPEIPEAVQSLERLLLAGVGTVVHEKRHVRKDGSFLYVRSTVFIQRDGDGQPLHFTSFVENINPRRVAEEQVATMQAELQRSELRYRTAFQTSADAININRIDDGVCIDCNKAFLNAIGYSREEVVGNSSLTMGIWARPEDRQRMLDELARTGFCRNLEAEFETKARGRLWGMLSASPIEIDGIPCVLSVTRDISDAKAIEKRLDEAADAVRMSEERYRMVFQMTLDAMTIKRLDTMEYLDVNQEFLNATGFERSEVIGKSPLDLGIWTHPEDFEQLSKLLVETGECRNLEALFTRKDGQTFWGLISATLVEIAGTRCALTITRDITSAKAAEDEIRSLAFYDPLTGLPNRRLLLERLQYSLSSGKRCGDLRALLFVDLDHFKTLNDTLGHQTGDMLLQQAARRLQNCVRESDTLGRLGGDEFVLMLEDLSKVPEEAAAQAKVTGEKILATLSKPFQLGVRECRSSASIGISVFGDRRETTNQILQQADIAMYQAKAAGRNTMRFFAPALQAAVNARAAMQEDLREGIQTGQFELYYQPQITRNRLDGAEALVRWNHPWRNILGPCEFIPLAEETGLILPLGQWVLEAACKQIAAWSGRPESAGLSIAVNISARQFRQPDFVQFVLNALNSTGANPSNLGLELTESMLVDNVEEVSSKMRELQSFGLKFALDDFGTGYSSLAYLKKLPLSQLKIDRSFVRDIVTDESSAAIAQAILSLSQALGLPVIAEGVETEDQRQCLARMGCNAFQGYLFSRPLPIDQFEQQWLGQNPAPSPKPKVRLPSP